MKPHRQEALKHHYVPQFYLEAWAGSDGKLCATKRIGDRLLESRLAPKSTAFEERLYSFKDEPLAPNPDPDVIETTILNVVDNAGARAYRRLLDEGPGCMTDDERRAWAVFLNAMFERDPRLIRNNEATARKIAAEVLQEVQAKIVDNENGERAARLATLFDMTARASNMVLRGMVEDINNRNVLEYLEGMWWVVIDIPSMLELHTSNRPLVVNAGRSRTPIEIAWMALSPSKLFALLPKAWLPQEGDDLNADTEGFFRTITVYHNFLLLMENPERLYSRSPISEAERQAAIQHLRNIQE